MVPPKSLVTASVPRLINLISWVRKKFPIINYGIESLSLFRLGHWRTGYRQKEGLQIPFLIRTNLTVCEDFNSCFRQLALQCIMLRPISTQSQCTFFLIQHRKNSSSTAWWDLFLSSLTQQSDYSPIYENVSNRFIFVQANRGESGKPKF